MNEFDRHLAERKAQTYASTRRWSATSDHDGLRGERGMAKHFGAEQDLTNKPLGDGGVDLELRLVAPCWFKANAKFTRTQHLMVNRLKLDPDTIYVSVVPDGDGERCAGWEWGHILKQIEPVNRNGNGAWVHQKLISELRPMEELDERFVSWRHTKKETA